jgi:hypothetical protein
MIIFYRISAILLCRLQSYVEIFIQHLIKITDSSVNTDMLLLKRRRIDFKALVFIVTTNLQSQVRGVLNPYNYKHM